MVIAAINQSDVDRRTLEFLRGAQATKSASQDHDLLTRYHCPLVSSLLDLVGLARPTQKLLTVLFHCRLETCILQIPRGLCDFLIAEPPIRSRHWRGPLGAHDNRAAALTWLDAALLCSVASRAQVEAAQSG